MTNKYAGYCIECKVDVAPGDGEARKSKRGRWYLLCESHGRGSDRINIINIGGNEYTQNARGRCEDAPCCGCCTI